MHGTVSGFIAALAEFWRQQVHLQQLYLDRHDVTGQEGVRAMRRLRWVGTNLAGDLLDERDGGPGRAAAGPH